MKITIELKSGKKVEFDKDEWEELRGFFNGYIEKELQVGEITEKIFIPYPYPTYPTYPTYPMYPNWQYGSGTTMKVSSQN
jgi:xanthine dehydrogenase iron-sulfur cluster and FAD-binding subunit A